MRLPRVRRPQRPPRPCKGCFGCGARKTVRITGSTRGVRSNPYRSEVVFYGRLTRGSRSCGNPRLREVSPLGNVSAACGVPSQGPIAELRDLRAWSVAEWHANAGPRRAMGEAVTPLRDSTNWKFVATSWDRLPACQSKSRRGIGFQPVSQNPVPWPRTFCQPTAYLAEVIPLSPVDCFV